MLNVMNVFNLTCHCRFWGRTSLVIVSEQHLHQTTSQKKWAMKLCLGGLQQTPKCMMMWRRKESWSLLRH